MKRDRLGAMARIVLPALAIVLAGIWVYAPAIHGTWVWDDGLEIARNPLLRSPAGWWRPWVAPAGLDYLPLKDSLQWVEWRIWGAHPAGYHAANLSLHLLSAFLLWRVLGRLGMKHGWLGGLLFAVHPLAVESVAWIAEFKNGLSLALLLLAFDAYVKWDARAAAVPGGRGGGYGWSVAWFLAAMLAKSSVVMFPAVLLLYAWWRRGRIARADLVAAVPFAAISLAGGLAAVWFQRHRAMMPGQAGPGLGARLAEAGVSVAAYARSCVDPAGLAPVYGPAHPAATGVAAWLAVAGVLGVLWAMRRRWGRHALFGAGWFLLNLAPALGVIPMAYSRVAPRADHFAYLALAGFCGLAAAGLAAVWDSEWLAGWCRPVLGAAVGAVLGGLAVAGRAQAAIFQNDEVLWTAAVARAPAAWLARNNLGRVDLDQGKGPEALEQLQVAVRLKPDSAEASANLGSAEEMTGRPGDAEADYRRAIRIEPSFAPFHYDLGKLLLLTNRTSEAAPEFQAALRLDPGDPRAHNMLGLAVARQDRPAEALREFRAALALDPDMPEAHLNVGNALFREGQVEGAVAEYRKALKIYPGYLAARRNLAYALQKLGRTDEAAQEIQAVMNARGGP